MHRLENFALYWPASQKSVAWLPIKLGQSWTIGPLRKKMSLERSPRHLNMLVFVKNRLEKNIATAIWNTPTHRFHDRSIEKHAWRPRLRWLHCYGNSKQLGMYKANGASQAVNLRKNELRSCSTGQDRWTFLVGSPNTWLSSVRTRSPTCIGFRFYAAALKNGRFGDGIKNKNKIIKQLVCCFCMLCLPKKKKKKKPAILNFVRCCNKEPPLHAKTRQR